MQVDKLADPNSNSAELCDPRDGGIRVEWQAQCCGPEPLQSEHKPASRSLGYLGPLEVRVTRRRQDVRRAQRLRYEVFYKYGRGVPDIADRITRRDRDRFDSVCDHLVVVDHSARRLPSLQPPVIGTYRLLRQDEAERGGGFYSSEEFDISGLLRRQWQSRFLELGRSCVLPNYRTKRIIELLWRGIGSYVNEQHVDVMIGCASFDSTDISRLERPLSYLHHFAHAPDAWHAAACSVRRVEMNWIARGQIDAKAAWHELPPLVKGYLRLGAFVGDGAVIDPKFGTTDVLIILPVSRIGSRYINRFGVVDKAGS